MARQSQLWRRLTVGVATTALLVLSACSSSTGGTDTATDTTTPTGGDSTGTATEQESAGDQVLRIGLSADVADLKPSLDQGAAAMMLDTLVHRGLLGYDASGKVVPALAAKYEASDSNKTFTFTLRDDAKFSDGTQVTSEDVKNTLEYLAREDVGAKIYSAMSALDSVETPDATTVIVHLKTPNSALPEYLADTTAAIVPAAALAAEGTSWEGAGPFVISNVNKGVSFTLEKNPNYYDASDVKLDQIRITVYADGSARTNALLSGDVDLVDFVPWENIDRVKESPGYKVDATSGPFMYIHFNVTHKPFDDEKVRQAIALAVNRDNVVSAAFSGQAAPIAGAPIDPSSPYYDEKLAHGWDTDVNKAKELLAEAGLANGFKATLLTSSQYAFHQDTALSVQADLAKIGIDVTLDAPDWATRQEKALAGEYDMAIGGSAGVVNDPSFLANFVTGPAANNRSFGFDDPTLDDLLQKGLAAPADERKAAYDAVQEQILKTVPFVSLVGRSQAFGMKDTVQGFTNIPGFLTFESGYTLATASVS